MQKTIWLVTHGETQLQDSGGWCPDPRMTSKASAMMTWLTPVLVNLLGGEFPPEVHCGTGARQYGVALALNLDKHQNLRVSGLWGDASTLINEDGRKKVLLGHGLIIEHEQYDTAKHVGGEVIRTAIRALPHNTVICSGRPVLIRLGMKPEECLSGAIYAFQVQDDGVIQIKAMTTGEVLATK